MPSGALLSVIDEAAASGVLLVGAAGNDGLVGMSWPAASPNVIGVAALDSKDHLTAYTNRGVGVELCAPGGDENDHDGDGYADGILAETQLPGDTTALPYFWSGSSQAAAQVSGLLARMLVSGVDPEDARVALKQKANSGDPEKGVGAGRINVKESTKLVSEKPEDIDAATELHVAMLPYLIRDGDDEVRPAALFAVVDGSGTALKGAEVYADYDGSSTGVLKCKTNEEGWCLKEGDKVDDLSALAWSVQVGLVRYQDVYNVPGTALMMTDQLEVMVAAIDADSDLAGSLIAVSWGEDTHDLLGDVAESVSLWNSGSGLVTSPLGIVFNWAAINGTITADTLDLDGSGLVTSPLGFIDIVRFSLDGSGLVTSPLGFGDLRLIGFDGTGLVTSPLGFDPGDLIIPQRGTGLVTSPLGFGGDPILMHQSSWGLSGSSVEAHLTAGGFLTEDAYPLATQLTGAGYAGLGGATTSTASGAGHGAPGSL